MKIIYYVYKNKVKVNHEHIIYKCAIILNFEIYHFLV